MALGSISSLHRSISVSDLSQVGEARRAIELEAQRAGFDPEHRGRAAIVATEIATNIARHSRGGEILFGLVNLNSGLALEILGIDRGPGMPDPERCLDDGYSTRSTPGNGLGAIQRQSDEFDLYSSVERGTVVVARMHGRKPNPGVVDAPLSFGGVCVAYPGEPVSGDAWRIRGNQDGYAVLAVDGLGHGILANEAAEAAADTFESDPFVAPAVQIERIHRRIQGTRGATVAVALFDARSERLSYSGVGNIAGRLLSAHRGRGLISANGTVGANLGRIQQFEYECPGDMILVMHSDGVQTRWEIASQPGLLVRHPAILAGVLYRDFQRGKDDVSAVVVRWTGQVAGRGDE